MPDIPGKKDRLFSRRIQLDDLVTRTALPSGRDFLAPDAGPAIPGAANKPVGRTLARGPVFDANTPRSGDPRTNFVRDRLASRFVTGVELGGVKPPATRIVPDTVKERPGGVLKRKQFLSIDELFQNIVSDPNGKGNLAISVTGGGARGPYEAGVIEAIFKVGDKYGVRPRIVSGTSAGAICATCTFVDLMYPKSAPSYTGDDIFFTRQAKVWRDDIATGNNASKKLFDDMAWVIEFATRKKGLPGVQLFFDTVKNLDGAWKALQSDVTGLATAGKNLVDAFTTMDGTQLAAQIKVVSGTIATDQAGLKERYDALVAALNAFDLNPFDGDTPVGDAEAIIQAAWDLLAVLAGFMADLANGAFKIGVGAVESLLTYLQNVGDKLGKLAVQLGKVAGDAGTLAGNAILLGGLIAALVGLITVIIAHAGEIILGAIVFFGGKAALEATGLVARSKPFDHVLPNDGIMGVLDKVILDAAVAYGASSNTGFQRVSERWNALAGDPRRPEIFLAGTDLDASRQMVFAYAAKEKLARIAADNVWVYDMAGQLDVKLPLAKPGPFDPVTMNAGFIVDTDGVEKAVTANYFRTIANPGEPLVKATMTSSTIPGVFEPHNWPATRRHPAKLFAQDPQETSQTIVAHRFVDGGLIDNSPVDLAVLGSARHVISIELSPLLSYDNPPDPTGELNMLSIVGASFGAAMDGSLQRSLSYLGAANEKTTTDADKVNVYRMAPMLPPAVLIPVEDGRKKGPRQEAESTTYQVSPGIVDFDGLYSDDHQLVMNLYDWFIQGYIDGMGYSGAETLSNLALSDPVIKDYLNHADTYGCNPYPFLTGNRFWYMAMRPMPEVSDYVEAVIGMPTDKQLARLEKAT